MGRSAKVAGEHATATLFVMALLLAAPPATAANPPLSAPLAAQLGRCVPPVEYALSKVYADAQKYGDWHDTGYGNDATHRLLEIDFAWATPGASPFLAILETHRVEVCWVGPSGPVHVHCPGWAGPSDPNGNPDWIILDDDLGISPPLAAAPSYVDSSGALQLFVKGKNEPADASIARKFTVPLDWDATTYPKIAFLVVNATQQPATLKDVDTDIDAGGFCGVPLRLATKEGQSNAPPAYATNPGSKTNDKVALVAYGVPAAGFGLGLPGGWNHGDVCNGQSNKARFSVFDFSPCVNQNAIKFAIERVKDIDQWQFEVAQGGLPTTVAKHTWWNGAPAAGTTCDPQALFCPTRFIPAQWLPPASGAGYGWGGVFSHVLDNNYKQAVTPVSKTGGKFLRDIGHEYTHGLNGTWTRFTGSSLFDWGNNNESTADAVPARACITQYPGTGTPVLHADQCISSQTLYYNDLVGPRGAGYLQDPGNLFSDPIFKYQGAIFYQYVASQFAYPSGNPLLPQQFAHLTSTNSVSPVLYTEDPPLSGNFVESLLKDRHPDEGMDLLGYLFAALDTRDPTTNPNATNLPCNGKSPDMMSRLGCVMEKYVGRSLDEEFLEFNTMLVLKDYTDDILGSSPPAETDPRWRQDWWGDYNAGHTAKIFSGATYLPAEYAIRTEKPYLGPTDGKGAPPATCNQKCCKFPSSPADLLCDGLPRAHRVQDTYICAKSAPGDPCVPGQNVLVNTVAKGATLASPHDVEIGALGSAYVSIHPEEGSGNVDVHAEVTAGDPRFRVFAIDKAGVPILASGCDVPKGHEACVVGANGAMTVTVPVGPTNADELLLVASAGKDAGASFSWRFGPAANTLRIVSPLASQPAVIGQYDAGALETKPFVMYFTAKDAGGKPISNISPGNLDIIVNGVPISGPNCDPTNPSNPCAFTLFGGSGGSYMALVTLPPGNVFYPPGFTGREDLKIALWNGTAASDTAPQALEILAAPQPQATVLVLDTSGSMNDAGKLPAARLAAKLALDSMAGGDYAGLVLFSTHSLLVDLSDPFIYNQGGFSAGFSAGLVQLSETDNQGHTALEALKYVIDHFPATGSTSIGDGLFRAEDALVTAFGDDNNTLPQGVRQGVMLLSDGANNCEWSPRKYVITDQSADAPLDKCTDPNGNPTSCFCDSNGCECDLHTVPKVWPWPQDQSTAPYAAQSPIHLGYNPRSNESKPVPFFTGVGVGQADMGTIDELATSTGGVSFWVPDPPPVATLQMDFADGFRMAQDSLGDYQCIATSRVHDIADLPPFRVDAGTTELLVSVLSVDTTAAPPGSVGLVSPSGAPVTATGGSATDAVFRVASPATGTWSFQAISPPPGASGSDPLLFAEIAVRSPCRIFTRTLVDGGLPLPLPAGVTDDQRWLGRDLLVQALLHDGMTPRADASVEATITAPDGAERNLMLFDDGLHDDGQPGDGLFGARFHDTAAHQENAGDATDTYRVRYHAAVSTSTGLFCPRERVDSATLHAAPDLDQDGLPDWWQEEFGLLSGSAGEDPDRDGSTNGEEFAAHTNPLLSDSDGGGESDSSEISAGRDPLDPADDATGRPVLVAVPGNGRVLVQPGVAVLPGVTLEIQSGPTRQGPFTPALSVGSFSGPHVDISAANDVETCFTARLVDAGVTSGWAWPACATARLDPVPPYIHRVGLAEGRSCVVRPSADLAIEASDAQRDVGLLGETAASYDPDVQISGLSVMRLSPATSDVPGDWQPFSSSTTIELGGLEQLAVVVRVKDGAENESQDVWIRLERCHGTGLSDSILLEEQALELFSNGDVTGARALIEQSLLDLEQSLAVVNGRLQSAHDPDHSTDTAVHAALSAARGNKKAALHAAPKAARELVEKALEREYDAEDLALAHQKAL
jgi:hypothetical protein